MWWHLAAVIGTLIEKALTLIQGHLKVGGSAKDAALSEAMIGAASRCTFPKLAIDWCAFLPPVSVSRPVIGGCLLP